MAAAISKMEGFVIIVNGRKPLTIITKRSILDVAAALDPPLIFLLHSRTSEMLANFCKFFNNDTCKFNSKTDLHRLQSCLHVYIFTKTYLGHSQHVFMLELFDWVFKHGSA